MKTRNIISFQTARYENFTQTHLILKSQYDRGNEQLRWIILARILRLNTMGKRGLGDHV